MQFLHLCLSAKPESAGCWTAPHQSVNGPQDQATGYLAGRRVRVDRPAGRRLGIGEPPCGLWASRVHKKQDIITSRFLNRLNDGLAMECRA
jgi:hypothetical protein